MSEPVRKKRPRPPTPEEMEAERGTTRRNGFIALGVLSLLMPALFFVNLVRERHRHDEELGLVPASPGAGAHAHGPGPSAAAVLDNADELEVTPHATVKPSRHDVAFSIGAILADARRCLGDAAPFVRATWQVNPDGSATDFARASGTDAADAGDGDAKAVACVKENVGKARVAPFDGAPVRVAYTFRSPANKP
jgi:hypothetical protein